MKRVSVLAVIMSLAMAGGAFAQLTGGTVNGVVKDQQGLPLPGVTVVAQGVDGATQTVTDATGHYRFIDLAPGPYTLNAELSSFTMTPFKVSVLVGRTIDADLSMAVAGRSEAITVKGEPIVDPTVTGTATNFTSTEIEKIPTSRDPFALLRTVPGVMLTQVNVGGNDTGGQPFVTGKGARQQDTTWTLDGVEITDMGAPGQSPTYFNFDNFEEIHVTTAGNDIRTRTGGVGINMITKRGTNNFHGGFRGYFSGNDLESANVPDELTAIGVTPATADHTSESSDYGFEFGGPLLKNRAWFYGSYSKQMIQIYRRTTSAFDKTELKNPQVKFNWQATKADLINFLYFNGTKLKDGRPNNAANGNVSLETIEATHHQENAYSDNPLHGMWKIGDDRVFSPNLFVSARYAYYNTGIKLTPEGGMDAQAGRTLIVPTKAYGSTLETLQIRPQHFVSADANQFVKLFGMTHDFKYGAGYRSVLSRQVVEWPGNGIVAITQTATDLRAQVFRQIDGANRANYFDFYVGDSVRFGRATVEAAVRYDHQGGEALPSTADASKAFPALIPGVIFAGYDSPFTWNTFSPRAGLSYRLDEAGKTIARVSYSRFAGQLSPNTIGTINPTAGSTPGNATYRWTDVNGDTYAQANEVDTTQRIGNPGGGLDLANPTVVTSTNQLDPNLKPPVTQSFVLGFEREMARNLAVLVDYTYNKTSDLFNNMRGDITPRVGVTLSDYTPGSVITGTFPDGNTYSVQTYVADPVKFAASKGGFYTTTVPGYYIDHHGVELGLVKRMSNRWMGRVSIGLNNDREHFSDPAGLYDTNGNPTPLITEPLADGGPLTYTSAANSGIYMNAGWQFNANGMYLAPRDIEVGGSIFARQGYPNPIYRVVTVGTSPATENLNTLVTPAIDTYRHDNVWDTDIRVARDFRFQAGNGAMKVRLIADFFNMFNANTALIRINNITPAGGQTPTNFNQITQNVFPRIMRLGVVVGF